MCSIGYSNYSGHRLLKNGRVFKICPITKRLGQHGRRLWDKKIQLVDMQVKPIIRSLLQLDPAKRATLLNVLADPYFDEVGEEQEIPLGPFSCFEMLKMREKYPIVEYPVGRINLQSRTQVYDWLAETNKDMHSSAASWFLATYICDTCITKMSVPGEDYQEFCTAALYIASTFIDVHPFDLDVYLHGQDERTIDKITKMVSTILTTIEFDLNVSTSYNFLKTLDKKGSKPVTKMAKSLLYLLSMSAYVFKYLPSTLAAIALLMATVYRGETFLHESVLTKEILAAYKEIIMFLPMLDVRVTRFQTKIPPLKDINRKLMTAVIKV